jgi:gluconolactonase
MNRREFLTTTAVTAAAAGTAATATRAFGLDKWATDRDWSGREKVTYPDPAWEIYDKSFKGRQGNTPLERLWTGALWAEGPVWMPEWRCLVFSDIPNHRTLRWTWDDGHVSVFQQDSHYSNGHTRDREGRVIACEHDSRRVTRLEVDGSWTVLMDRFNGKKLNAPNDVAVTSDGAIWFTDPGYGILGPYEGHKAEFELPANVYRLDPHTGTATVVVDDFRRPNGICFSPDETRCYVVDTGATDGPQYPAHIRVFDVVDGKTLRGGKVFADFKPGFTDGIRCDTEGNVWCGWGWGGPETNGVRVHSQNGEKLAMLHMPEIVANLDFGGPKKDRLFMAGSQSLYAIYVNAVGALRP